MLGEIIFFNFIMPLAAGAFVWGMMVLVFLAVYKARRIE